MLSLLKNQWITAAVAQWMMSVGPSLSSWLKYLNSYRTDPRPWDSDVTTRLSGSQVKSCEDSRCSCAIVRPTFIPWQLSFTFVFMNTPWWCWFTYPRVTQVHLNAPLKVLSVRKADFWASFPTRQITDGRNTAKTLGGVEDSWLLLFHHQQVSLDGLAQKSGWDILGLQQMNRNPFWWNPVRFNRAPPSGQTFN